MACTHFDRPRPPYAQTGGSAGAAADEHGAVFLPYFDMEVVFDDRRTREQLGLQAPPLRVVLRHADGLRRRREVGQARHVARGGAGAGGGAAR